MKYAQLFSFLAVVVLIGGCANQSLAPSHPSYFTQGNSENDLIIAGENMRITIGDRFNYVGERSIGGFSVIVYSDYENAQNQEFIAIAVDRNKSTDYPPTGFENGKIRRSDVGTFFQWYGLTSADNTIYKDIAEEQGITVLPCSHSVEWIHDTETAQILLTYSESTTCNMANYPDISKLAATMLTPRMDILIDRKPFTSD